MLELNKIYNQDCLKMMKNIEDNSIDLIVTDPPYKTIQGGNKTKKWQEKYGGSVLKNNDGKIFQHNDIEIKSWIKEAYRVLKNETHFYCFTNVLNMNSMIEIAEDAGFYLHNILIWKKNNCLANRWYMKNAEFILFFKKRTSKKH